MGKMKDSGIEWIGEIPEDWKVVNFGNLLKEHKIKNSELNANALQFKFGTIIQKKEREVTPEFIEMLSNYNVVEPNVIMINGLNLAFDFVTQRVAIVTQYGVITSTYIAVEPIEIYCSKYANYLLKAYDNQKVFHAMGRGLRCMLSYEILKKEKVLYPPFSIQQQIAAYLDKKCALVERLIENQRRQIENLKEYKQSVITETVTKGLDHSVPMKDSGIEWIGEIPEDWKVIRLKYVCKINPSINLDVSEYEFVGYVPMECVKNGYMESREIAIQQLNSGLTVFKNGDIVMAKVTPCFENGNIAIVSDLKNGVGYGSSELFVFRPIAIRTKFLFYFLRNHLFMEYAKSTMTGTGGLKRVSPTFIKSLKIACPNVSEQHQIAAYLDKKCAEIDALIAIKQQKIDKLQEYKKSLIYEYVTGKKEVL